MRNTHFKPAQVLDAMLDMRFWLASSSSILILMTNGPASTFPVDIVRDFGFTALASLLVLMPLGLVTGTVQLAVNYLATRYQNIRCLLIVVCQSLVVMAALLLWLLPRANLAGLLVGVYFLGPISGSYCLLMTLQIANTAGYTKRAFTSAGIFVGYCIGNIIEPLLFKMKDAPQYTEVWIIVVVTSIAGAVLAVTYRVICQWENRRRDKSGISEAADYAFEDDLTDRKVSHHSLDWLYRSFRYEADGYRSRIHSSAMSIE